MDKKDTNYNVLKRISGTLHRVVPVADQSGKIISYALKPFMCEFRAQDIIQVIIGAALLAMPVCLTEEAWTLGEVLPTKNVVYIAIASTVMISIFVYYNIYRSNFRNYIFHFFYRVVGTYLISLIVVALILLILDKFPWESDRILAIKTVIIVTFPASLGGTLSDMIK
ncbi:DUF2391 family protein [Lutimonas zeaxanthinifaciens]|uniref:DUF2391 family protein n=1 Tax=Lutimonas zeaxanthinifaciens TaxID=3060215 RepID=UPI00265D4723|nr:DUF2391 family protein [Lutimonas sp. YSD2104]WKK65708.1 DUF2391 family protein [Lutimonas sp. YSD2104]